MKGSHCGHEDCTMERRASPPVRPQTCALTSTDDRRSTVNLWVVVHHEAGDSKTSFQSSVLSSRLAFLESQELWDHAGQMERRARTPVAPTENLWLIAHHEAGDSKTSF